jgi:hypothetical protein
MEREIQVGVELVESTSEAGVGVWHILFPTLSRSPRVLQSWFREINGADSMRKKGEEAVVAGLERNQATYHMAAFGIRQR